MKLRYYGDSSLEADHEAVVGLLEEVHERWAVPVSVERVRARHGSLATFPGPVREADVETVYDRDFADNAVLAANVGHDVEEAFATENGFPTITGAVGVVDGDDDRLLWSTLLSGEPPGRELFGPDAYSVGFLREVLAEGPRVLAALVGAGDGASRAEDDPSDRRLPGEDTEGPRRNPTVSRSRTETSPHGADSTPAPTERGARGRSPGRDRSEGGRSEEDLLAAFVASAPAMDGVDRNALRLSVAVGDHDDDPRRVRSVAREFGTRTVDAVVRADRHWVVETASHLSAAELDRALGAVTVAETLYRQSEDLGPEATVPAVLFERFGRESASEADDGLELLADSVGYAGSLGVEVFVRDRSRDPSFRRLTDYEAAPSRLSIDSRAT